MLNIIGMFDTIRSSSLYKETATYFVDDLRLSESDFYEQLEQLDPTNRPEYVTKLSKLVSESVLHYWQPEHSAEYNIRLPWSENFILRALSYVDPKFFAMYEFQDHHRALARGVGLCSQHAIITAGFLAEKGIPAKLIELQGHVILTAEVDEGQWWLVDPDYGVVVPFSLDDAEEHAKDAAAVYEAAGFSDYDVDKVEDFFKTKDNVVYDGGAETYQPKLWFIEMTSYWLKWLIPTMLMLPVFFARDRRLFGWLAQLYVFARRLHAPTLIKQVTSRIRD